MRAKSVIQTSTGTYRLANEYDEVKSLISQSKANDSEFIELRRFDPIQSSTSSFPLFQRVSDINTLEYGE